MHARGRGRRVKLLIAAAALMTMAVPATAPADDDPLTRIGGLLSYLTRGPITDPRQPGLESLHKAAAGPVNVAFQNGAPRFVQAEVQVPGANSIERAMHYVRAYKGLYGLFMDDPFAVRPSPMNRFGIATPEERARKGMRRFPDGQAVPQSSPDLSLHVAGTRGEGDAVVVFSQTYRGLPVRDAHLVVFTKGDRVLGTVGTLVSDAEIDVMPSIDQARAIAIARGTEDMAVDSFVPPRLEIFDASLSRSRAYTPPAPRLAWHVVLSGPHATETVIDAHTGEVLSRWGTTREHGGLDLDLEDANGENSKDSDCYWDTTADDQIGDEAGLTPEGHQDPQAVALWGFAHTMYDFLHSTFGRHSYDGNGGQFELYIHSSTEGGATWHGGDIDCDLVDFSEAFVGQDVLAHEMGHALQQYSLLGPMTYEFESGAVAESQADAFASLIDNNWTIGENRVGGGGPIRDMSNPPSFVSELDDVGKVNHPDKMSDFVDTMDDKGGVHINSGIGNKAYHLMAAGGTHPTTGWNIAGIGKPAMGWLAYNSMQVMLPTAGFAQVRDLNLMFATQAYGTGVVCSVRNAWAAVEVGNGDVNCDGIEEPADADGDDVDNGIDNCPMAFNPSQIDTDSDGKGNVCDGDADEDGVLDPGYAQGLPDNCPGVKNPDQTDGNFNGIGKACDPTEDDDYDDDGVKNLSDNCPFDPNPWQVDVDADGDGDACDPDSDGDGLSNDNDNCPFTPNATQTDSDGDGIGDACDKCSEVADESPAWAAGNPALGLDPHPLQPDSDGDGTPDACDYDVVLNGDPIGLNKVSLDGRVNDVDLQGAPQRYLRIPLKACPAKPCSFVAQSARRLLTLNIEHPSIKAWVADERGRTVARASERTASTRRFVFSPLPGHDYYLNLYFSASFAPVAPPRIGLTLANVLGGPDTAPPPPATAPR